MRSNNPKDYVVGELYFDTYGSTVNRLPTLVELVSIKTKESHVWRDDRFVDAVVVDDVIVRRLSDGKTYKPWLLRYLTPFDVGLRGLKQRIANARKRAAKWSEKALEFEATLGEYEALRTKRGDA